MNEKNRSIFISSFWVVVGQFVNLLILFVTNFILARLLTPDDYGTLGILMFFISLSNVLIEGGFSGALIRKSNRHIEDYSTMFIVNMLVSIVCYVLVSVSASFISEFYGNHKLTYLIPVASLVLVFNSFQIVQNTKLMADMKYRQKNIYEIVSNFLASCFAIFVAFRGWGVWALIVLQLSNSILKTILLWVFERFFFSMKFSLSSFKSFINFGVFTSLSSILNVVFDNIYQLVLGKVFSLSTVGYYYQSKKIIDLELSTFSSINQGPLYSGLARHPENSESRITGYIHFLRISYILYTIATLILVLFPNQIIMFLLGKQWISCSVYLQLLAIYGLLFLQENYIRIFFKLYDKTQVIFYIDLLKKAIQGLTIVIGVYFQNLSYLLYGLIFSSFIGVLLNSYYSHRYITMGKQDIKYSLVSIIIVFCVYYCLHIS